MSRGSIKRQANGRWQARYRDNENHQHTRRFDRKADGERWLAEESAKLVTGTWVSPNAGKLTFREYAEQWRVAQTHRPTTRAQAETHLRRHAYPTFGDRQLSSVRHTEIRAWVTKLGKSLAPSTTRTVYSYLAAVFKAAVDDRLIAASPCGEIKLQKATKRKIEPLPVAAVEALTATVPDRYRALITLGAGTGLRQGEAFAVSLDRVDFLRKNLTVDRQVVLMPGMAPYLAPPKTEASIRDIPLPDVVIEALAAHLSEYPATEQEIEYRDGDSPPQIEKVALLFTSHSGAPIRRTRFSDRVWGPARTAVREAATKAQAEADRAGTGERVPTLPADATYHDLRHFYASLLIRHGESVKVVQARMGHWSAQETLDTYSHLWPDSDDSTRAAIDSVLGHRTGGDGRTGTG